MLLECRLLAKTTVCFSREAGSGLALHYPCSLSLGAGGRVVVRESVGGGREVG